MSLISFIQKLQEKPRYIRFQILWLTVFICMFIILSLWVVSLKHSPPVSKLEKDTTGGISQSLKEIRQDVPSLIGAFKSSISSFFEEDFEEDLKNLEELYYNELEIQTEEIVKPAKLPLSY